MMGLRKFFVLSAALALALVGSGTALGQDFCSVSAAGVDVRAEGITEVADEIVMSCFQGPTLIAEDYTVTVEVIGDAQITNRIDSVISGTGIRILDGVRLQLLNNATQVDIDTVDIAGTDITSGTYDGQVKGALVAGQNTMMFQFTRPAIAGATSRLRIKITGIRVNASTAGVGNPVRARVTASETPLIGSDLVTLVRPREGIDVSEVKFLSGSSTVEGVSCAKGTKVMTKLNVAEGFVKAFTTDRNGQKMRLKLTLKDLPDKVKVHLRPGNIGNANDLNCDADRDLVLHLLTGLDANGFGQGTLVSITDTTNQANPFVEIPVTNGSAHAFYEVDKSDEDAIENCQIPVYFTWPVGAALGTGTMDITFARTSTVVTANVEDALLPRFKAMSSNPRNVLTIEECSTTLLFPFVTNQAGHDTGIVIANTSQDAFGTEENTGACKVYYYGAMEGGGAAPNMMPTESVAAGGQLSFQLSDKAAGFQGYLMARCDFQFAHGSAFITNGFGGGAPTLGQSYLALVVPVRHGDRGTTGGGHESLGQ